MHTLTHAKVPIIYREIVLTGVDNEMAVARMSRSTSAG